MDQEYGILLREIKNQIAFSRYKAALKVNKELILLYHQIGTGILKSQKQHGWGAKVIDQLSQDLRSEFPDMKGFSTRNLKYMRKFAEEYSELEFVQQVAAQLPWFHIATIMDQVNDKESQIFYMKKSIEHGWSRSVLVHQIESKLHNRQGKAVSNFRDKLPYPHSELAQEMIKNPYLLDFLGITEKAQEREIENALMQHMQKFLVELGAGFAFMGRQYHLEVGGEDFYLDMLFYNIKLRSFIVVELKSDKFKPEHAGKMSFYLSVVDDFLKHPSDNPSIGLILCKTKNEVVAEYTLRDVSKAIGLSEYKLTESLPENLKINLPTIEELEAELTKTSINQKTNLAS